MCIWLSRKLPQLLLLHAPDLSPKTVVLTLSKNKSFHTLDLVGRSWEKQAKNIVVFSEFISSFKLTYGVADISRVGLALGSFRWLVVYFWHWQIQCMHCSFGGWNSIMLLAEWYRCSYQDGIRLNEIIGFLHVWVHQWISSCVGGWGGSGTPHAISWYGWILSEVREGGAVLYHHWRQGCLREDASLPKKFPCSCGNTPRKFNSSPPQKWWLEDYFPIGRPCLPEKMWFAGTK